MILIPPGRQGVKYIPESFGTDSAPSPDGWWRAPYAGTPWEAEAGAYDAPMAAQDGATSEPAVGAALNGHAVAAFDGVNDGIGHNTSATNVISAKGFTLLTVARIRSAAAAGAFYWDNPALINDAAGNLSLFFSASGIAAAVYNGGAYATTPIPFTTDQWFMAAMRFSSATNMVRCRVNETNATPVVAAGPPTLGSFGLIVGQDYAFTHFGNIEVAEIRAYKRPLIEAELDAVLEELRTRYGVALV